MTLKDLAEYNGHDGKPSYVAVSGTIYDVSKSPLWEGGNHVNAHQAGCDLTEELKSAPHVRAVIERFPVVGKLEMATEAKPTKEGGLPMVSIVIMALVLILLIITFII
ncbi:MAG: hypothetical protein C0622_04635 [Desulfuromonas sp.]|nr:MAG: hypothetical protein C0622_04635 [Desulfuromonas sp.]